MHSSDLVPFNGTMLCQVKWIEEFYSLDIPKSKGSFEIHLQIRAKIQQRRAQPLVDKGEGSVAVIKDSRSNQKEKQRSHSRSNKRPLSKVKKCVPQ